MANRTFALVLLALVSALLACSDGPRPGTLPDDPGAEAPADPIPASAKAPLVVFLGDSLTAGNGLAEGEAFPALIQARLAREGRALRIVNAGVSGDTSAGGLARLDWMLKQDPDIVVVALGSNDGLRGLPVAELEHNLTAIITRTREAGARVLLVGMRVPPNYGDDYSRAFAEVYPRLAEAEQLAFVPFLLDGVGGQAAFNQADGIHPNAAGQALMAETVFRGLLDLLPVK